MTKRTTSAFTAAALTLSAAPVLSDTINGDLTVRSYLCVGGGCADGDVSLSAPAATI